MEGKLLFCLSSLLILFLVVISVNVENVTAAKDVSIHEADLLNIERNYDNEVGQVSCEFSNGNDRLRSRRSSRNRRHHHHHRKHHNTHGRKVWAPWTHASPAGRPGRVG